MKRRAAAVAKVIESHWRSGKLLVDACRVVVALFVLGGIVWPLIRVYAMGEGFDEVFGIESFAYDFLAFWSASNLIQSGQAAGAYDIDTILSVQQAVRPEVPHVYPWLYPPSFFLVVAPLALLPLLPSYWVWLAATLGFACFSLYRLVPRREAIWFLLAAPLVMRVVLAGQGTFLVVALMALAWTYFERRPLIAGLFLGLLTIKPQLGLLIPLALLCGREWRVFAAASVTGVSLAVLSASLFGTETWSFFFRGSDLPLRLLEDTEKWHRIMPTVYATLRFAGTPSDWAYLGQICTGAAVAALVGWLWWRRYSLAVRVAALASGVFFASPYFFDYDVLTLAPAVALLAWHGHSQGWLAGERTALIMLWLLPTVSIALAYIIDFQLALAPAALLLILAIRRARMEEKERASLVSPAE